MGTRPTDRGGHAAPAALVIVLLLLLAVMLMAAAPDKARAVGSYAHDGATACGDCHTTVPAATSGKCIGCHTSFEVLAPSKTCWTCHNPGQSMAGVGPGAPATCTQTCHRPAPPDTDVPGTPHDPHPQLGLCTTCHNVSTGAAAANGSPHHTANATTVSLRVLPTTVRARQRVRFTGTVTPVGTLTGARLVLTIQRRVGASWRAATTLRPTVRATTGAYSASYRPTKKGAYRARAAVRATDDYFGSLSKYRTFRVR